jgi:hypothetical protein
MLITNHVFPQSFSAVGYGFNQPVYSLYADTVNQVIYAGGMFTPTVSVQCNRFCLWNGQAWDSLNNILTGDFRAICKYNNQLLIAGPGGTYDSTSGQWLGGILRFNDQTGSWNFLCVGSAGYWKLTEINGDLYVGGTFDSICGNSSWKLARFDGQNWFNFPVLDPAGYSVFDIIEFNNEIYIGGNFGAFGFKDIARWDGAQWNSVNGGFSGVGSVRAFAVYQGKLIVGGYLSTSFGDPGNGVVAWDGTNWSQLGSGVAGEIRCMAVFNNELWVGGGFLSAGNVPAQYLAKWDGSQWNSVGISPTNVITAMTVLDNELYIAGGFVNVINGDTARRIMKYSLNTGFEDNSVKDHFRFNPNPSDGTFEILLNFQINEEV